MYLVIGNKLEILRWVDIWVKEFMNEEGGNKLVRNFWKFLEKDSRKILVYLVYNKIKIWR